MSFSKKKREAVYAKYDGHCAYCGRAIDIKDMRIVQVTKVDNVASQDELQTIANRLMSESQQTVKTISFETFSEGNHGIGDAISIDHPDIGGIYEETAWSITLGAGELMKHTAKRTVIA